MTEQFKTDSQHEREGFEAYRPTARVSDCPYAAGTREYVDWCSGWAKRLLAEDAKPKRVSW